MDPVSGFLVGCLVVSLSAQAASWMFNKKTEDQEKYNEDLRNERDSLLAQYESQAYDHFINVKEVILDAVAKYRSEKVSLKEELQNLRRVIRQELQKSYITINQQRALQMADRNAEEAIYRLESYFRYLAWYEGEIEMIEQGKNFHAIDVLPNPDSHLPEDYLHIGKLVILSTEEIRLLENRGMNWENKLIVKDLDNTGSEKAEIPVLITKFTDPRNTNNGTYFGSVLKGTLLWNYLEDMNPEPFNVTCINDFGNFVDLRYEKLLRVTMKRSDKLSPLKKYRVGGELMVYPLEWDLLLNNISVSERMQDYSSNNVERVIFLYDPDQIPEDKLNKMEAVSSFTYLPWNSDIHNKFFIARAGDTDFKLQMFPENAPNHVRIVEVLESQSKEKIMTEFKVPIDIMGVRAFDPEVCIGLKNALAGFVNNIRKEFEYQSILGSNPLSSQSSLQYFDAWSSIVDVQMLKNEFRVVYSGFYEELKMDFDSNVCKVKLTPENWSGLKEATEKYQKELNFSGRSDAKDKPGFEFWASISIGLGNGEKENDLDYQFTNIGSCVSLDNDNGNFLVYLGSGKKLDISAIFLDDQHYFEIKVRNSNYVFSQQKKALKGFKNNELVNPELKRIVTLPEFLNENTFMPHGENKFDCTFQNMNLTNNQKETVLSALQSTSAYLIQGPPGTGKTTVIKEIVYQYLTRYPLANVLIVAQQNVAVDNALEGIYTANISDWFSDSGENKRSLVRCGNEDKIDSEIIKDFTIEKWFERYKLETMKNNLVAEDFTQLRNEWNEQIDKDRIRDIDPEILQILLKKHQIIGATCVGLASKKIGLDLLQFDLTLIDEAGRSTPPELLIPILRTKKLILIGDHYQLPPMVSLDEDDTRELGIDKKFLEKSLFETIFERAKSNKSVLTDQFRMPNQIGDLISDLFYDDFGTKLRNGRDRSPDNTFFSKSEMYWLNCEGREEKKGTSRFNKKEVTRIVELLSEIQADAQSKGFTKSVAVITPYGEQKRLLRERVQAEKFGNLRIKIDTIDSFQGQEAHVVIYSTVRTYGNTVFLLDKRRLNVAISRTKENIIFVGHKEFMRNSKPKDKEKDVKNYFAEIIKIIEQNEQLSA